MIEKNLIRVENITYWRKPQPVLQGMSFTVQIGECLVLLGPNGSGKTTALNLIGGLLMPDQGRVLINGLNVHREKNLAGKLIGFLPDTPPLYPELTVKEHLELASKLYEIPQIDKRACIENALDQLDLQPYRNHLIGLLSKGLKQRVGIAQVILHRPRALLLDEPTQGLDKEHIDTLLSLLQEYKKNAAVILSTHHAGEIDGLYDKTIRFTKGYIPAYDFDHCET